MHSTQNERINQITSSTLIVGVDIAKFKHVARAQAGLSLKENTSGKHKGQTKITKRGRKRLRGLSSVS